MKSLVKKVIVWVLHLEARLVVRKYKPKVVGITGSVGKTSAKEAVALVLSQFTTVRASAKSYNSEFGMPLTVLGCASGWNSPLAWIRNICHGLLLVLFPHPYPEWLVLEMGVDHPGDIALVTSWLPLNVGVVTRVGEIPVHVEFFPSPEALAEEKSEVVRGVRAGGAAILNHDDATVLTMGAKTNEKIITFGFSLGSTLRASNDHVIYREYDDHRLPEGITFKVDYEGKSVPVRLSGVLGRHSLYTALVALAVGVSQGYHLLTMAEALKDFRMPPGRLRLLEGIKDTYLIDDTYNSSPAAANAALEVIKQIETKGRRIAVLGDMMELGKYTIEAHHAVGAHAAASCDILITVGLRAKFIAEGARDAGMAPGYIHEVEDAVAGGVLLKSLLERNDVALIKGSQYMRMERTVLEVMRHSDLAHSLLCRQDPEWQVR